MPLTSYVDGPCRASVRSILKILDPFCRVVEIHDVLPDTIRPKSDEGIAKHMPQAWPTVEDLRVLHAFAVGLGWTKHFDRDVT